MPRKESYIGGQDKRHMQRISGARQSELPMSPHAARSTGAAAEAEADLGRYYVFVDQVLQRGVMDGVDEFLADGFMEHGMDGDRDRDGFLARIRSQRAQYPNGVWTIELLVAVNGLVICHATMVTPARSALMANTWESIVVRFDAGKMAESWRMRDETLLIVANEAQS